MSEMPGLTLPSNSLEIATALRSFSVGICALLVEREGATYMRDQNQELEMETLEASYSKPVVEDETTYAATAELELWIPGSRISVWNDYNRLLTLKTSYDKKLEAGLQITRTHTFELGFGCKPIGAAPLEAVMAGTTTSVGATDASVKSTTKEFGIDTTNELGQRLSWATHIVDVIMNPEKYPATQLLI
jgi:hypothetical protein